MSETPSATYQVLARKYRPARFDDLIGQDAMVRTLRNAFSSGRIAHAWMLTGVRGVGKTTTARILARALNYETEDGSGEPTIDLPEDGGVHGQAILEGRHPDVIEIDAASHTGIDDIRDIIESARYMPVSARNKVYIVDEVHMLSKAAFNGLLKTLEEPPEHVKFIFATTEIRKVPVTVLSRCQRFDLHRVDADLLIGHLATIAERESVAIEDEALRMIARAAEGSVRDALSILDQGIAHGAGSVDAEAVRSMLGLADRTHTLDLFEMIMRGDPAAAIENLSGQYQTGADPYVVLSDLAEFNHFITRLKLAPDSAKRAAVPEEDIVRGTELAQKLSIRVLSRTWQMLLKGLGEVQNSSMPLAAAEMVIVRLCHAADLPSPEEAIRDLQSAQNGAGPAEHAPQKAPSTSGPVSSAPPADTGLDEPAQAVSPSPGAPRAAPAGPTSSRDMRGAASALSYDDRQEPVERQIVPADQPEQDAPRLRSFTDIVALAKQQRDRPLVFALERQVRPVKVDSSGRIEIALTEDAPADLPQRLGSALLEWTGQRWIVIIAKEAAEETIHAKRLAEKASQISLARSDPLVAQILAAFEGAEITSIEPVNTEQGSDTDSDIDAGSTSASMAHKSNERRGEGD